MNSAYSVRKINRWTPNRTVAILIVFLLLGSILRGIIYRLTVTARLLGVIAGAGEIEEGGGTISTSGSQAFATGASASVSQSRGSKSWRAGTRTRA
jgi:hypothetical protein